MSQAVATRQKVQEKEWGIDRRVLAHLGPAGQVLDVGCGDGRLDFDILEQCVRIQEAAP